MGNRQSYLYNLPRLESEAIDARGFRTLYRYDLDGNLLQRADPDGARWDWSYDSVRNVTSETDALGFVTEFLCFNADGNPGEIIDSADPGRSTVYLYDTVSGAPRQLTDKRGNVFTTTFVSGQPTQRRGPVEGADTLLEERFYDPVSHRLDRAVQRIETGSVRNAVTAFFYRLGTATSSGSSTDRDGDGRRRALDELLDQADRA
jgi:YD repeat-containing protein